ncbi:hydrolase [Streptomyces phage Emma1919]|nr:hydrolase [Streptomyces phage Emma1919]
MHKKTAAIGTLLASMTMVVGISTNAEAATIRSKAYSVAKAQLGDRYCGDNKKSCGGSVGPNSFDCSGLVQYSYKKAGKYVPRTTQSQFKASKDITVNQRQLGDVIYFSHKGTRDHFHVGIYAGSGYMIHANAGSYYGKKVIKEKISSYWGKNYNADYRRLG